MMTAFARRMRNQARTLRMNVLERDEWTCVYCGQFADKVDHVLPVNEGGRSIRGNLVAACLKCNARKGARVEEEQITTAILHLINKGEDMDWIEAYHEHGPECFDC